MLTIEKFIEKANKIHGKKYNYSKVNYINMKTKICIICPEHGEFWQTPTNHIYQKQGCPKCNRRSYKYTLEEFIEKAIRIHGNEYNYSKVKYINNRTKICIICPEHGEFWQSPNSHISQKQGCPKCGELKNKTETHLYNFLINNTNYKIIRQKTFKWLGRKKLDIFIEDLNIGIEYQGRQHFETIDYFGGLNGFNTTVKRDTEKFQQCNKHGIKLLYVSYEKNIPPQYLDTIYTNNEDVLKEIKKYDKNN